MPSASAPPSPTAPARAGHVRTAIAPSLGRRLYFGWLAFVAGFFTATMSPGVVIQSVFRPGARTFRAWMRPWGRIVLRGSGIRVTTEIRAEVPEPVVFVVNHQNGLDIPALSAALPVPFVFSAKKELHSWPFVGWVLARTACLFIDRSGPKKALRSLQEAAERIRGGASVILFPEGGRSWRHGLLPFMRGPFILAIQSGVPVVPVALVGNTGVLDERHFLARPGEIRVVLGEPIPTDGLTRRDAGALSDRVRDWMEAELRAVGPLVSASGEIESLTERATEAPITDETAASGETEATPVPAGA
ncbi:MAG: lysophospholipid acyltransferase family protein [Bacteroidota bacterium]